MEFGSRPCPGNDQEKGYLGHEVQDLHSPRLEDEPQYLIKSDKTDHMAMHKGAALKKISTTARRSKERSAHPKKK